MPILTGLQMMRDWLTDIKAAFELLRTLFFIELFLTDASSTSPKGWDKASQISCRTLGLESEISLSTSAAFPSRANIKCCALVTCYHHPPSWLQHVTRLQSTRFQISATGLKLVEGRMRGKCNRPTDFSIFRTLNKIASKIDRFRSAIAKVRHHKGLPSQRAIITKKTVPMVMYNWIPFSLLFPSQ